MLNNLFPPFLIRDIHHLLSIFYLPMITVDMNLEGIELYEKDGDYTIIYGDRGSNYRSSTIFLGSYNETNDDITKITSLIVSFPEIINNKRNIADLSLDESDNLWGVATSDPGDSGPFKTYLYIIGKLNSSEGFLIKEETKSSFLFLGQKVEALMFSEDSLYMMTDNERHGSTFLKKAISDIR